MVGNVLLCSSAATAEDESSALTPYSMLLAPCSLLPAPYSFSRYAPRTSAGQRRMRIPPFMGRSVRRDAPTEIHQSFGRAGAWIVGRPESRPVVVTKA